MGRWGSLLGRADPTAEWEMKPEPPNNTLALAPHRIKHTISQPGINMPRCAPWGMRTGPGWEKNLPLQQSLNPNEPDWRGCSAARTSRFAAVVSLNSTKPGPFSLDRVTKGPKSSGDTFSLPENPSTPPLKTEYFLENNRDEN